MKLNTYLSFAGTCEAALKFYEKALDGKIRSMKTFGDSPVEAPEDKKDLIMHAEFDLQGNLIMACDDVGKNALVIGTNISMSILMEDVEKGGIYFNQLAEGGQILMPYQKSFWGATFGMLTDKFGINWMINVQSEENFVNEK